MIYTSSKRYLHRRPFLWLTNLCLSPLYIIRSLQYLTVAIFTVFKNITIVCIALGEQRIFRSRITPLMWISFALIVRVLHLDIAPPPFSDPLRDDDRCIPARFLVH